MALAASRGEQLHLSSADYQLRRLASSLNRPPREIDVHAAWRRQQAPHPRVIRQRYGSLKKALMQLEIYQMLALEHLIQLTEKLGRRPTTVDINAAKRNNRHMPSVSMYNHYFGGLDQACRLADIPPPPEPNRFEMLQQLRQLAEDLKRGPNQRDIASAARQGRCPSVWKLAKHFGSYQKAYHMSGIEQLPVVRTAEAKRLQRRARGFAQRSRKHWTARRRRDCAVAKQELRELGLRIDKVPSRRDIDQAHRRGDFSFTAWAVARLFDGLPNAVVASGVRQALAAQKIKRLADRLGHVPSTQEIEAASLRGECYSTNTLLRWFGSLHAAFAEAGFRTRTSTWRTDRQLLADLQVLATKLGRAPAPADINRANRQNTCAHKTTYIRRFGSIPEALRAAGLVTD